jgi:ComF family protein
MPNRLDSVLEQIGGWWLPARCVLCGRRGQPPCLDICYECERELPRPQRVCPRCGATVGAGRLDSTDAEACAHCATDPPPLDRLHAAFVYAPPVDSLVHALKYRGRLAIGRVLGELLARSADAAGLRDRVDAIVPTPLHPSRHAERGFNQATEIARWTARRLDLECNARLASRRIAGPSQVGSTPAQRRANLYGVFAADANRVRGRAIAIVDDVVTTGSTTSALASALLAAGACRVDAWCVALAGGRRPDTEDAAARPGTLAAPP